MPPSVEQRQGIAETLANALPGVEHGQARSEGAVFCRDGTIWGFRWQMFYQFLSWFTFLNACMVYDVPVYWVYTNWSVQLPNSFS